MFIVVVYRSRIICLDLNFVPFVLVFTTDLCMLDLCIAMCVIYGKSVIVNVSVNPFCVCTSDPMYTLTPVNRYGDSVEGAKCAFFNVTVHTCTRSMRILATWQLCRSCMEDNPSQSGVAGSARDNPITTQECESLVKISKGAE